MTPPIRPFAAPFTPARGPSAAPTTASPSPSSGDPGARVAGRAADGSFRTALRAALVPRRANGAPAAALGRPPGGAAPADPATGALGARAGHGGHAPPVHARPRALDDDGRQDAALDPATRHAAQLAPPPAPFAPPVDALPPVATRVAAPLEAMFPALVKRIAWSGDARRGTMRLELDDAGPLAGAVILIHADGADVRVEMSSPHGVEDAWRDRIASRLASRGLRVAGVDVG